MPYYQIHHPTYGVLVKADDNIAAARLWAKRAFPREPVTVVREGKYQFCGDCQCAPCCCMVREDV